jgi:uncharacterized 2Fe-2S/4Fe-4S cluster protein (DUF4445 family)
MDQVEQLYISGGFGSYINLDHVREIGMLNIPADRISRLGNTALIGAKMFLFDDPALAGSIQSMITHISLESEADFQDLFIQHLSFDAPAS